MSKRKRSYYEKSLLAKLWGKFSPVDEITEERMPDTKTLDYLESSYPSNHNYVLEQGKLIAFLQTDLGRGGHRHAGVPGIQRTKPNHTKCKYHVYSVAFMLCIGS